MSTITLTSSSLPVCHIFVDASNVNVSEANIPGLSAIAHRGFGTVRTAAVVGTTPQPSDRELLWSDLGYNATFTVRAPGQPESAYNVDATIVAWVYQTMADFRSEKSTIVLVTGDGNDNGGSPNFAKVVRTALNDGWNVKLVCLSPSPVYVTLQRTFQKSMQILRITTAEISAATANPVGASVGPSKLASKQKAGPLRSKPSAETAATVCRPSVATNGTVGGNAALPMQRSPAAGPMVVAPRAAKIANKDALGHLLMNMIEQGLSSGCTRFSASVGPRGASFTRM